VLPIVADPVGEKRWTGMQAVRATRGQWKRSHRPQEVLCPVCGQSIVWPDFARATHLRRHLHAGWVPTVPMHVVADVASVGEGAPATAVAP